MNDYYTLMLGTALLILLAVSTTPSPEEAGAAIISDAISTAILGGGNAEVTWGWIQGLDLALPPTVHVDRIKCQSSGAIAKCAFVLIRTPAPDASAADKALLSELSCEASFELADPGNGRLTWQVVRYAPPHQRGPARTTMDCRKLPLNLR